MKFDELNLDSEILAGIAAAGFEECTGVQEQAMPHAINGADVMVQSQTGTGKTAAFLLPTYQLLLHNPDFKGGRALVVAPTRELAVQIKEESDVLSENLGLRTEVFHGGVGYGQQQSALAEGVDILVGTPGRMLDLSQSGHMRLKDVQIVIIDEADRLFDMGFYPDIRKMFSRLRPREERVNMLFSATLSTKARNIAWEHMNSPVEIEIEPEHITVDKVTQAMYHVASEDKMSVLLGVFKKRQPRTAIVFTNTKRAAEEVAKRLEINGYPTEFIIGDLPQRKRQQIIQKIKSGESEFLVATDVAARGLHINDLDMVVNYDLPEDPEAYVHRIGRTARAGESGAAVALACQRYVFGLEAIETLIRQKIPVEPLTDDMYAEDASAGMRIRTGDSSRDSRDSRGGRDSRGRRDSRGGRDSRGSRDSRGGRDGGSRDSRGVRDGGNRDSRRQGERTSESRAAASNGERSRSDRPRNENAHEDKPRADRPRNEKQPSGTSRADRPQNDKPRDDKARDDRPRTDRGSRPRSGSAKGPRPAESVSSPKSGDSLEDRLAYYRQKYGEDFQPTDEMLASMEGGGRNSGSSKKSSSGNRNKNRSQSGKAPAGDNKAAAKQAPTQDAEQKDSPKESKKGVFGALRSFFGG